MGVMGGGERKHVQVFQFRACSCAMRCFANSTSGESSESKIDVISKARLWNLSLAFYDDATRHHQQWPMAINEPHFLKQRSRAAEDHKCSPISGPSKRQRHTQRSPEAPQIPALGSLCVQKLVQGSGRSHRHHNTKHKAPFNVEVRC